ncbi:MAG TPA: glycoside hydrolase family protein [Caulobacteraceae bacterium]|nr:glycoside hydrolase family protein [Caulobacteraceae bacterium]
MTSAHLIGDLKRDEGLRLKAYPDPRSGAAPWTIGYGHTGPEVREGLAWTRRQADLALAADVENTLAELDGRLPWWLGLDPARADVLANMAFNLGVAGLASFASFLALVKQGHYARAGLDLLATDWARQVGCRARRLALQLSSGVRLP